MTSSTIIPPTPDRDSYRAMTTDQLLEATFRAVPSRTNWEELAIALAERLDKKDRELEDAHYNALAMRVSY